MPTLSKYPKAFLSLVGLNSAGENPRELSSVIAPVVDTTENYLLETLEFKFGANAAGANGYNAFAAEDLEVPVGEVWRVHMVNISVVSAVGQTGVFAPALRLVQGVLQRVQLLPGRAYAASSVTWDTWNPGQPMLLPAGSEIGVELTAVAGGAPTVISGAILFNRLRA